MGWLFGKKKTPRVPFPEGKPAGEGTLEFPQAVSSERVIRPEKVKEAAGVDKSAPPLLEEQVEPEAKPQPPLEMPTEDLEPIYVKVDVYRRMLGEIDSLKHDLGKMMTANSHLLTSEYNEEGKFTELRRKIRSMHDGLLKVDKRLFKTQGE